MAIILICIIFVLIQIKFDKDPFLFMEYEEESLTSFFP